MNKVDRKAYQREYYLSNRERLKARAQQWREQHPEQVKAGIKLYYENHRDGILDQSREYREANRERIAEAKRTLEYRQWKRQYDQKYRAANPNKVKAKKCARRAAELAAPGSFTAEEIHSLLARQGFKCGNMACRVSIEVDQHIDHVMPLSRGGTNWIDNIQILCPACNLRKSDKDPYEWAKENGLLFC